VIHDRGMLVPAHQEADRDTFTRIKSFEIKREMVNKLGDIRIC
jgi:hypothetical protein